MQTAILIPVKDLGQAKTRLAEVFSGEERRELAQVLLTGVLEAGAQIEGVARRVMITNYPPASELAERLGFEVLRETHQTSESDSVDAASATLEQEGMDVVLRLPLDLPLINPQEVMRILECAAQGAAAVLVPSRDRTGTNAILRAPPTLFPSRFGPGSLDLHCEKLEALGACYEVLTLESLALDIDDPDDVAYLLECDIDCPAAAYLQRLGALERLAGLSREGA